MKMLKSTVHYESSVCGGSFESVLNRFGDWKREPLVYRPERRMFEGKDSVRRLGDEEFDSPDQARRALIRSCAPRDRFALAAPIRDDDRRMWLVMAAFEA
ncbi:hypothetical protein I6G56_28695 [Burkholderia humptydooensis]|uniref:Uncharacterized protein n=2 Tax=Burkholderia humptydooensis TaxID=430531 RepID=A0A7U4PC25_9BURK|nr:MULTISPECIES: hypothetical protein [Burkholderia]AJY39299.1 hypothetical protein BW21_4398 [Burkholderia sp. 2002721687]ALX46781.1 hypothetical protein AQ610_31145 [Burkholderia humptydooensis]EIP86234.1 hypothetical protein A33K_17324 [Burkholderia humptydooensis MSMB43]QPS46092.1 hypothetical protein I6G56_28695 [Burkholderia humptydooensis]